MHPCRAPKLGSRLLLSCALWASLCAQPSAQGDAPAHRRPRIGLVLSGGGARGAAHIGVLEVLERLRIPVDYIAGTSMGSAVGGLYAEGMTASELKAFFDTFDWQAGFLDGPPRSDLAFRRKQDEVNYLVGYFVGLRHGRFKFPLGAVEGQHFVTELRKQGRITGSLDSFDRLPIPFRCVASDLEKAQPVVISSGDLAWAMRASAAIPPLFSPVHYQGRLLIDGGYMDNIPVDVARDMGADILIVVDITTPLLERKNISNIVSVMSQTARLEGAQIERRQLASLRAGDILITPDLKGLSFADFDKIPEIIRIGEEAAESTADRLRPLALSEADYKEYLRSRGPRPPIRMRIDRIAFDNGSRIADRVLRRMIRQKEGEPLDPGKLQEDLAKIYGLGYFEHVDYNVVEKDGKNVLLVLAPERSWGPGNLRFGLALMDNFRGNSTHSLAFRYTRLDINSLGAELQTNAAVGTNPSASVEFLQPLDYEPTIFSYGAPFFAAPRLSYSSQLEDDTLDGHQTSRYRVRTPLAGFDAGCYVSNLAELRVGVERYSNDARMEIGDPASASDFNWDGGDYFGRITVDTLDRPALPLNGEYGTLEWRQSTPALGADRKRTTVDIRGNFFKTLQGHTVGAKAVYSSNLDVETPTPRLFSLGGFMNLSAFPLDGMIGSERIYGSLFHYSQPFHWAKNIYLGQAAEWGGTWWSRSDVRFAEGDWAGTVYLGARTPFGPVYLAFSQSSHRRSMTWLTLGSTF